LNLSKIASEEDRLVEGITDDEAKRVARFDPIKGIVSFRLNEVALLPIALRRRLVRWALREIAGSLEGFAFRHVEEAGCILAREAGSPKAMQLPGGLIVERDDETASIRIGRGESELLSVDKQAAAFWPLMDPKHAQALEPGSNVRLEAGWTLNSEVISAQADRPTPGELIALFDMDALPKQGPLVVRTRREGDWLRPLGMKGRKTLQDLYVDAKI